MIDPKIKDQIDSMNYETMLRKWRTAPIGYPLFQGETGDYFKAVMHQKKEALSHSAQVCASKRIGWDG